MLCALTGDESREKRVESREEIAEREQRAESRRQ
jgi:hypothetical protein